MEKIRLGEIVQKDKNPVMVVSKNYEEIVKQLSSFTYPSEKIKFLACLVISQTEKQYKKYLIHVLKNFEPLPVKKLIESWQSGDFDIGDADFRPLLTRREFELLTHLDLEGHLEDYEKDYPSLFKDGLSLIFYPSRKKGIVYWRRMTTKYLKKQKDYSDLQRLILYFTTAQLLISWESSCIHLGMMILDNWDVSDMFKWFSKVWPIYREGV